MKKTLVLDIVALSSRLIGAQTPFLDNLVKKGKLTTIEPVLPAVTTSAQYTYLTGKWPSTHGIVGNGWYFRDESEVKFWRQSNKLVQAEKLWETARKIDPDFTCANMFWWYNMYSTVDYSVTPRPMYPADGRKIPDVYSHPMDLRFKLQEELGTFPLFEFWGPRTSINSSKWIADATKIVDKWYDPTLTLVYLPHLDYCLQKFGHDLGRIGKDLAEIDEVVQDLVGYFEGKGAEILILSEYGITEVNRPVHLNRVLREHGYLMVKEELGLEYLDAGASRAFAVADHQMAHIYLKDNADLPRIREIVRNTKGVDFVLDETGKMQHHLHHDRAGDLVALADERSWFTYYYWMDDALAPDFARTVDIHRKPGFDPVEMFVNPDFKFPMLKAGWILLKKKLGFRYLMDLIPLDASLIKGSHGRFPEDERDHPVLISPKKNSLHKEKWEAIEVFDVILETLKGEM